MIRFTQTQLMRSLSFRTSRSLILGATAFLAACQADSVVAPTGGTPDRISVSSTVGTPMSSFGDSATVAVRVFDAGGATVTGVPLIYKVSAPGVVESLGNGIFRAVGDGQVTVTAEVDPSATGARPAGYYANRLTGTVTLQVRQVPARIIPVSADTGFTALGLIKPVVLRVTDARGNPMGTSFSRTWSTDNPQVATVDVNGNVRSIGSGTTRLTYSVGTLTWSATVIVNASRQHVSCMRYTQRRNARETCVTNTFTLRGPRGGTP